MRPGRTGGREVRPRRWSGLGAAVAVLLTLAVLPTGTATAPTAAAASTHPTARAYRACVRDSAADFRWTAFLYVTFLHRSGSFAEVGSWLQDFVDGRSYQAIAYSIDDSAEAVRPLITAAYQQLLHRTPSPGEVTGWVAYTRAHSTTGLAGVLAASAEAYAHAGGTNEGWVRQEYQDILGRPADAGGLAYWQQRLAAATSASAARATVARALWNASEHLATRVDAVYRAVLGRAADPGGLAYWSATALHFGDQALGSLLASTQEAWNLAQTRYGGTAGPLPPVCPPAPIRWVPAPGTVVHSLAPLAADGPRLVALTFDDGPNPTWTPQILQILDQYNVPATFFLVGYEVQEYPNLVREEVEHGNHVAVHTMTHPDLTGLGYSAQEHQIVDDANLIDSIAGAGSVKCFRPPYGAYNSQIVNIAANRGLATVLWSRDGRDWARPGVPTILANDLTTRYDGGRGVILSHDGGGNRSQTVAMLPTLIQDLRAQGYQFVNFC